MIEKWMYNLFRIPNTNEKQIRRFIINKLEKFDVPYVRDKVGNLFYLKYKDKPLLSAHMDSIIYYNNITLVQNGNILLSNSCGFDDKVGVYLILKVLKKVKINFVFTIQEEHFAIGIRHLVLNEDVEHFFNIPFALVLDRKGGHDIICFRNQYGSLKFERFLVSFGHGFKPARGLFSDANYLRYFVSTANLSVGYYNPHSIGDYLNLKEMTNTYNFVRKVIKSNKKFDVYDGGGLHRS